MTFVGLILSAYLIQKKIATLLKSEENAPKNYKPVIYAAVTVISIAISITLLVLASHILQNLDTRLIYFYGGQPLHVIAGVMMISQTQFQAIIGLGIGGAPTTGIALFSVGKLVAPILHAQPALGAKTYPPHTDM